MMLAAVSRGWPLPWVDLDYFRRFYQAIDLGDGSEVVLFRPGGGLLARYPSGEDELGRAFAEEALFRHRAGQATQKRAAAEKPGGRP